MRSITLHLCHAAGIAIAFTFTVSSFAQVGNFDNLNGYASGLETRLATMRDPLVRVGPASDDNGVALSGNYLDRKIAAAFDRIERNTNGSGATLNYGWSEKIWNVGLAVSSDYTTSDYKELKSSAIIPLHGQVKSRTTSGLARAGTTQGAWNINVFAGTGSTNHDGTRISDAGSSSASFRSRDYTLGIQTSYDVALTDTVNLTPFGSLAHLTANADGFTEMGTAPDRRIISAFSSRESLGTVGARLVAKQGNWIPSLTIACMHEFSPRSIAMVNSAIDGSNLGSGFVPETATNLFLANVRVEGELAKNWFAGAQVQFLDGGDERQWTLHLTVRRTF